jgi:hypothetical protein
LGGNGENPHPATRRLSAYATVEEITIVITALKEMIREARRAERMANIALGPLGRQRGEGQRAYNRRVWREMSNAEREIVIAGHAPVWSGELKPILDELREGIAPWHWPICGGAVPPLLDEIIARYRTAEREADETWRKQVEATPIDDAAWEKESERRRQLEDDDAHPERFIHRVG